MIESIHIKNFQSHKDTIIKFGPNTNIISGQSDSGKSAIVRALHWVCTNKPSGESFKSYWGGLTEAIIITDDEHTITRRRGKSINEYEMDGEVYKVPSNGVPGPIDNVLNMNELNWQSQHDTPYLLSESSGEVARRLNRIANLDIIDKSLINANTRRLDVLRKCESAIERKEELQKQLADFTWIKDCDRELKLAERTERHINKSQEKRESLNILIEGIEMQDAIHSKILIPGDSEVKKIGTLESSIDTTKKSITGVKMLLFDIEECNSLILLNKYPENIKEIDKKMMKYFKMEQDIKDIDDLLDNIEEEEKSIKTNTSKIEYLESSLPESCPLCGGKI